MKKYILLFGFTLLSVALFSQSKFGNATNEELEMTTYSEDTTASAVVLHKKGRLRFILNEIQGSFQFEYILEKKIKILKTEGLKYADGEIDYYVESRDYKEDIKGLSGTTYNLEGGKVVKTKLSKENIFDEDVEGKWKRKKFTMPAAKVGSVIEYKYTIVSDFAMELRDFEFQEDIPIDYVDFEATIPEYYNYNLNQQGYVQLDETDQKMVNEQFLFRYEDHDGRRQSSNIRCTSNRYIFKSAKIPAAKHEPLLWSINDYISKLTFELKSTNFPGSYFKAFTTTWNNVDKELMELSSFGGNLKHAGWFKDDIQKGEATLERAIEIEKMIKSRVKWNEKTSLLTSKLKKALNDGIGNSAEVNFLLINALNAGGFDAFPVILSTRGNGLIPITHPSITAFDYIITGVKIGEETYFSDAASKFGTWNLLPTYCIVSQARIMSPSRTMEWVDLTGVSTSVVFRQGAVKFADGMGLLSVKETRRGNDAFNLRRNYSNYENEEKYIQMLEENNQSTISEFKLTGYENNAEPLVLEYIDERAMELGSEHIYYTPPIDKIFSENPLKAETRTFPINFNYLANYVQTVSIEVPEGYEVAELPKSERIVLGDNDIMYAYNVSQTGNALNFSVRYQLRKLMFLPTEYEHLKEFIGKIINKGSEQIVFKKITDVAVADNIVKQE